jgi:F0F1-type ATP synthase epsilon subunit
LLPKIAFVEQYNKQNLMKIAVYSIAETLFEGEAEELIAYTPTGQITVLNEHIPLITTLIGPHISIIRKNEQPFEIALATGTLEVRPQSEVVALVEL